MKKSSKKVNKYEPTLMDVLEAVQTGFAKVDEKVDERFDQVDRRFEQIDNRFDQVDQKFSRLERRVGAVELTLEEVNETLDGVAKAVDKDAVTVLEHKRRIRHLEKGRALVL